MPWKYSYNPRNVQWNQWKWRIVKSWYCIYKVRVSSIYSIDSKFRKFNRLYSLKLKKTSFLNIVINWNKGASQIHMGKKKKMLDQQPGFDGVFTETLKAAESMEPIYVCIYIRYSINTVYYLFWPNYSSTPPPPPREKKRRSFLSKSVTFCCRLQIHHILMQNVYTQ